MLEHFGCTCTGSHTLGWNGVVVGAGGMNVRAIGVRSKMECGRLKAVCSGADGGKG